MVADDVEGPCGAENVNYAVPLTLSDSTFHATSTQYASNLSTRTMERQAIVEEKQIHLIWELEDKNSLHSDTEQWRRCIGCV